MDPPNGINNNDDGRHRHLNTLLRHLLLLIALFLHPMRPPAATKAFEQASKMLEELRTVLDRLDHLLIKITPNIDDNIIIPQINIHNNNCDTTSKNGSVRNEDVHIGDDIDSSPSLSPITSNPLPSQFTPPTTTSSTIIISRPANFLYKHPSDINEIIECLRRSVEIVALSERRAGALEEEETVVLASSRLEERRRRRRRDRRRTRDVDGYDNDQRNESQSTHISVERQNEEHPQGNHSIHDDDDDNNDDEEMVEEEVDVAAQLLPEHLAPFELFCERNVLSKIVGLVTGSTFDNPISPPPPHSLPPLQPHSGSRQQQQHLQSSSIPSPQPPPPPSPLLLPPLSIATQAVQSASILIQNVCRATSLYLLLSTI
jgi:hypothetical protein